MPTPSRPEYLTIEMDATDVIIGTKACWCVNMETLYNEEHRGTDLLVPGSPGVVANPRRLTVIRHVLKLVIDGTFNSNGVMQADAHGQARLNIEEIKAATEPVTTGGGTRLVTWTRPSDAVSADCHVGPLRIGERISSSRLWATLDLSVPAGAFT